MAQLSHAQLALLCSAVFLYAACFMAVAPLLPYQVKQLGAEAWFAPLQTFFSACQLAGGLLSGPLADAHGGKLLLQVSLAASAACYALTAAATSVAGLALARLATLLQHAVLAARALVTSASSPGERAGLLGAIGASYGIGFAVGPAAGGMLAAHGLSRTPWVAAAGSLTALALVTAGLPSDASAARRGSSGAACEAATPPRQAQQQARGAGFVRSLAAVLACRGVPALLLMQAGAGLSGALLHSSLGLVLQRQFGLDSGQNGLVLSFVGLCVVAGQAAVIRPAVRWLGEPAAARMAAGLLAVTHVALASAASLQRLFACLAPLAVGGVLLSTCNTARLTKAVPAGLAGAAMSLDMSLASGLRLASTLLGTWLLEARGFAAVCGAATALLLCGTGAAALLPQPPGEMLPRPRRAEADAAAQQKRSD